MVSPSTIQLAKAKGCVAVLALLYCALKLCAVGQDETPASPNVFDGCPFLPEPDPAMDWRDLHQHRTDAPEKLYAASLKYGHYLWRRGLAARALLAVDRGLLCASETADGSLPQFPFRAIAWMVAHVPRDVFIGNPRVHYQHLADRVRGERSAQKRWRSWACWWLVRLARPDLPADPRHDVREPAFEEIEAGLTSHGSLGELEEWRTACDDAAGYRAPRAADSGQNSRTWPE